MRAFELKFLLAGGSADVVDQFRVATNKLDQQKNVVETLEMNLIVASKGFMAGEETPHDIEYFVKAVAAGTELLRLAAEEAVAIQQQMQALIG